MPTRNARFSALGWCIDLANEIRGLFRVFGLRLASPVDQGSFDECVRPLVEADPDLSHALLPLLDARVVLYKTYRELDRRVKQAASHDEICLRFMAIPGVGPIAALTFRAAVDNPTRFTSSRTVAAPFGLTPRRYQSGKMDNPGRISKAGDRDVRAIRIFSSEECSLRVARRMSFTTCSAGALAVTGFFVIFNSNRVKMSRKPSTTQSR